MVDMIARVPVNRGSLLKSIENLLKTIESSENAVMIPTLLRDKVRVDAWELLFVAKILKASILGHSDLVEFYMNHIGHASLAQQQQQQQQQQATTPNGTATSNGTHEASLSPSTLPRGQSSPLLVHPTHSAGPQAAQTPQETTTGNAANQASLSSASSINSNSTQTTTSGTNPNQTTTSKNSTASWITATQQQNLSSLSGSLSSNNSSSSSSSSAAATAATQNIPQDSIQTTASPSLPVIVDNSPPPVVLETPPLAAPSRLPAASELNAMEAARPLLMRQAQPPSLLQLTTTNNHIASMQSSANHHHHAHHSFNNSSIEQLTNQLTAIATSNERQHAGGGSMNGLDTSGHLSISTGPREEEAGATPTTPTGRRQAPAAELRTSRSSGCLFRVNSGASSPRTPAQTPTTPYPQAETLDASGQSNALLGDPSSPVKLLLQIEQLKVSIKHVTTLLENVVELYKNSVDNIAQ